MELENRLPGRIPGTLFCIENYEMGLTGGEDIGSKEGLL